MRSDSDRVDDVLQAIDKINERIPDNRTAFMADEVFRSGRSTIFNSLAKRPGTYLRISGIHNDVPWVQ